MAPIFPISKLVFLFVKQVAKPLSTRIARKAKKSIFFRENICIPCASCMYKY